MAPNAGEDAAWREARGCNMLSVGGCEMVMEGAGVEDSREFRVQIRTPSVIHDQISSGDRSTDASAAYPKKEVSEQFRS